MADYSLYAGDVCPRVDNHMTLLFSFPGRMIKNLKYDYLHAIKTSGR